MKKSDSPQIEEERSFAIRLAKRLGLRPKQTKTLFIESSKGVLKVAIGQALSLQGGRPVHVEGVLRLHGMEYEISVDDADGSGSLGPDSHAHIVDRAAGITLDGEMPARVYRTLLPLIELEVDDIWKRAQGKKH